MKPLDFRLYDDPINAFDITCFKKLGWCQVKSCYTCQMRAYAVGWNAYGELLGYVARRP